VGARIVQLTYYSTRKPVSGGQKRIAALRDGLSRLGHDVDCIEVFAWMDPIHPDDFKFPAYDDEWARRFSGEYETRIADVLTSNRMFGDAVLARIADYAPDILWVEQPFMWPFLHRRRAALPGSRLVYSAHNIEWQVRRELARRGGLGPFASFRIQEIECDFVRAADLVVNVSAPDQRWCEDAGARGTVLVRNASRPPERDATGLARQRFRAAHGLSEHALVLLYVSAYWEPNWLGLAQWCLPTLEALSQDHDIALLLVGGIGIRAEQADLPPAQRRLVVTTGEIDEAEKDAAYAAADAVLLPVVAGGGTNLKSAEALLSDLPVVASGYAMRGLEALSRLDGVAVAQDKLAFAAALETLVRDHFGRRAAGAPPLRRSPDPMTSSLCSWEAALAPLEAAVERLMA
jgi:glycosyltransferase involved in cell wall biosynthesis